MLDPLTNDDAEWLEADGLGGFASGTISTLRTRRYHAWLLSARRPPTERYVLVNGGDVWIDSADEPIFLSRQHYAPDVIVPKTPAEIVSFETTPWPTWEFQLADGTRIRQEILAVHEQATTVLRWTVLNAGEQPLWFSVRPFLSGRDYHALHHENPDFQFTPRSGESTWTWSPYAGVEPTAVRSNGAYRHEPLWYRRFVYARERDRGLDFEEDLAAPGVFRWDLRTEPAVLVLSAGEVSASGNTPREVADQFLYGERLRRAQFQELEQRAADAYVVRRGTGRTLIAGYPWFTDWGRDTFISVRGLCLALGRLSLAEEILLSWADQVSAGMLPNRFPDGGESPEFNSVDASLWYVIAVADYFRVAARSSFQMTARARERLESACLEILRGYARGTRYGIRLDDDGLLAAGEPGTQLTWMDAKVGNWVVTPRIGKPVEIQALWLNALWSFRTLSFEFEPWFQQGLASFQSRFWNPSRECLYDVIDVDHEPGRVDASLRPNQIFAAGGLPLILLPEDRARLVVDVVERELLTPFGLRTLERGDAAYCGQYHGGPLARDAAYHQGTVWPWLLGPFVQAWLQVNGSSLPNRQRARDRFLQPLRQWMSGPGQGHLPEVTDGDPPYSPGGCPFQAWSLGEFLRLEHDLLREDTARAAMSKLQK